VDDVRADGDRVTVRYHWCDAEGLRLEWGQALRLRDSAIVEMEDRASGRGARRVARLFDRGERA
jgi:hypothetical protein